MKDLLLDLESKMVEKKVVEFKMKDGSTTKFSVDTQFLNTDVVNMIKDMSEIAMYLQGLNVAMDSETIMPLLMIKHFVKQVKTGNKGKQVEVELIKKENTSKEMYEMLIRYGNALINIQNTEGISLFEVLLKEFDSNKVGMKDITTKVNMMAENISKSV